MIDTKRTERLPARLFPHSLSICGRLTLFAALSVFASPPAIAQDVQRIAAVVNDEVISHFDLTNRIRLVITTTNLPNRPETHRRLAPQVLRTMIDEHLQMQEAKRLSVRVTKRDLKRTIDNLEKQNNMKPGQLDIFLANAKIEKSVLMTQLRSRIAWLKLIGRRLGRQVGFGEEEINDELRRLEALRSKPHNRVAEIFLSVDSPDKEGEVRQSAERLIQQIRNGARFSALAREFSQSTSAAIGGDIGWIAVGELDQTIEQALINLQIGQISDPVRTLSGYHILLLRGRRHGESDAADNAVVELRQILIPRPAQATDDDRKALSAFARELTPSMNNCGDFEEVAKSIGAQGEGRANRVRVNQISEELRGIVRSLEIGKPSSLIEVPQGILLMMVCSRAGGGSVPLPDRNTIADRLTKARLDLLAQRYLRDLRRSAYVDIRQ